MICRSCDKTDAGGRLQVPEIRTTRSPDRIIQPSRESFKPNDRSKSQLSCRDMARSRSPSEMAEAEEPVYVKKRIDNRTATRPPPTLASCGCPMMGEPRCNKRTRREPMGEPINEETISTRDLEPPYATKTREASQRNLKPVNEPSFQQSRVGNLQSERPPVHEPSYTKSYVSYRSAPRDPVEEEIVEPVFHKTQASNREVMQEPLNPHVSFHSVKREATSDPHLEPSVVINETFPPQYLQAQPSNRTMASAPSRTAAGSAQGKDLEKINEDWCSKCCTEEKLKPKKSRWKNMFSRKKKK